ncbi:hypothetical protein J891_1715 [Acinetobacter baumannii 44327_8]|uniref:Uncharacterized protein n=1 Tax=Acinetobacter baumannii 6014059 TaxID=525242 RepID=A0A828SQJ9_ACIBA|nr:hypothetical protein HMPREF0021_02569 [Acinetobacter baumannii 6013150]EGJ64076.1 hypothetical protein HMPREF0020_02309 [Acinetobacter baumannii 6013113]EGJ67257.1 hypothetical protein HMPREF0022_02989 [Acinetobacter baumannii 6014059]EKL40266.1 hypothetical protein ACIN5180_0118 [Acinetobacter baumannii OIFC180]EXA81024.1 hypothetical protein J543_1257 [Acinetobacter baumannii 1159076]EXB01864.1 hypothetical protein J519_1310 [Acinetobacter baumannii 1294217]EXB13962.1 hypothetical protei
MKISKLEKSLILLSTIGNTNFGDYLIIDLTNNCVYDAHCDLRKNICI